MRTISTPLPSAARSKFAAAQEVAYEPHSARPSAGSTPGVHREPARTPRVELGAGM